VTEYILKGGDKEEFLAKFKKAVSKGFDPEKDLQRVGLANQVRRAWGVELVGFGIRYGGGSYVLLVGGSSQQQSAAVSSSQQQSAAVSSSQQQSAAVSSRSSRFVWLHQPPTSTNHPPPTPPPQTTMLKGDTQEMGKMFERTMLSKYGPSELAEHFMLMDTICDATQVG